MTLLLSDESATNLDTLVELLHWSATATTVTRLHLQRFRSTLQQGELAI